MRTMFLLAATLFAMQPVSAIAQSNSAIAYGPTIMFGKNESSPTKKGDTKPLPAAMFPDGLAKEGTKATDRPGWSEGLVRSQTSIVASPRSGQEVMQATKTRTQTVTRTSHWSHPGSIESHLLGSHGLSFGDISGLSKEQMKTMHDEIHEGSRVSSYSSSTCPGGNCPRQTSQPRLFRWR